MITPSAPFSGTTISAVTVWDLFLMLRTQFSHRRPMPPNRSWVSPLTSVGLPAVSGFIFSIHPVVQRQYLVARQPRSASSRCSSCSFCGFFLERSFAWLQSPGLVQFPDVVVEGRDRIVHGCPWRAALRDRGPPLVVDAAVTEHLEVLGLVPLRRLCLVERVQPYSIPSIGSCWMPSTDTGSGMPAASRIVGATSIT